MKIQQELTKIGKLIKEEFLKGNFKLVKSTDSTATVSVIGVFFTVWIDNIPEENFEVYTSYLGVETLLSQFITFDTKEEKIKGYELVSEAINKVKKINKAKKIEELEIEIERLRSEG